MPAEPETTASMISLHAHACASWLVSQIERMTLAPHSFSAGQTLQTWGVAAAVARSQVPEADAELARRGLARAHHAARLQAAHAALQGGLRAVPRHAGRRPRAHRREDVHTLVRVPAAQALQATGRHTPSAALKTRGLARAAQVLSCFAVLAGLACTRASRSTSRTTTGSAALGAAVKRCRVVIIL